MKILRALIILTLFTVLVVIGLLFTLNLALETLVRTTEPRTQEVR
jgi:hypothetical protein